MTEIQLEMILLELKMAGKIEIIEFYDENGSRIRGKDKIIWKGTPSVT